ncbi:MAG: ABC transporter permease [Pseudohongiella nitratireducens]|nr:ABC transporter permease [Pseudohongiella nitratireducens]MDF1624002.1 ABC transporter permease [Pseudohongiella nitratireducens]
MLKHYLLAAWLSFRHNTISSISNILMLSLGLTCFIFTFSLTEYWNNAESHFPNADRTLVIGSQWQLADGSASGGVNLPLSPHHLRGYLESDFPQLESVARVLFINQDTPVRTKNTTQRLRTFAADPEFLDIFNLPFAQGGYSNALQSPNSAVITHDTAIKLFGNINVIGQTITFNENADLTITGVLAPLPQPSHIGNTSSYSPINFELLVSRDVYENLVRRRTGGRDTTELPADWFNRVNTTYVLFPENSTFNTQQFSEQLSSFSLRHIPDNYRQIAEFNFNAIPVNNLMGMAIRDTIFPQLSAGSVQVVLLTLGTIVMIVACVNFTNLATARTATRANEIGVRKVVGAQPRHIIGQYFLEAGLLTTLAMVFAILLLFIAFPLIQNYAEISLDTLVSPGIIVRGALFIVVLGCITTITAGFYPAVVLSKIQPLSILNSGVFRGGSLLFSKVLAGIQFSIAAFLLVIITVIYQQNVNIKSAESEIDGSTLLVIENSPDITGLDQETLRQQLLQLPVVDSATTMEILPWTENPARMMLASSPAATAVEHSASVYVVGENFFNVFDIDLIAGRLFDPLRTEDIAAAGPAGVQQQNLVISATLTKELGYTSAQDVIGESVFIPGNVLGGTQARPYRVIGVVEDTTLSIASRFGSIPKVFLYNPELRFHIVRLSGSSHTSSIEAIDTLWETLVPNVAIKRRFLSEYFTDSFAGFRRITLGISTLAAVAWFISIVGLYAMATLIAKQRIREIAIRKVLGAERKDIALMLFKNFSTPVIIANFIACPFAYFASRSYLDLFNDSIDISPWPFILTIVASLTITSIATCGQTWKAASTSARQFMRT